MRNLVWYLLAGTRGGETRALILVSLKRRPMNAHQLSQALRLDYKTIQHHMRVLVENRLVAVINQGRYGAAYFVSPELDGFWKDFRGIWDKVGKKVLKN